MKKTYLVVFEKAPNNYSGFSPDVPGCISVGDTLDEMYRNYQEALELYIESCDDLGLPIPEPITKRVTLPLEGETDPHAQYVVDWLSVNVPDSSNLSRKAA
jgi:predicted RNase H-like HicB family nuclease